MLVAVGQSLGQAEGRNDMAGSRRYAALMVVGNAGADK